MPPQLSLRVGAIVTGAACIMWCRYLVGGVCVLVSLVVTQELQRRKGGDVKDGHIPKEGGEDQSQPLAQAEGAEGDADLEVVDHFNESAMAKT